MIKKQQLLLTYSLYGINQGGVYYSDSIEVEYDESESIGRKSFFIYDALRNAHYKSTRDYLDISRFIIHCSIPL